MRVWRENRAAHWYLRAGGRAADTDPERRTWAAFLLGTMDGDRAFSIELLGVLAADPDPLVSRYARESQRQRDLLPRKKNLRSP